MNSSVEHAIAGEYQLHALLHGWVFQRAWHRARLDLVAAVMPPTEEGGLILDAAAGSGILTYRFPRANIVSADMRPAACRAVREHTPRALTAAGELTALPFRSGAFAQIYFLEALEHLEREAGMAALAELHRAAMPGAGLLITTPNYASHWVVVERVLDALGATPPMADAQHQSAYKPATLASAVAASGWRLAAAGSFNLFSPVIGLVSRSAAARAVQFESTHLGSIGTLLYARCTKDRGPTA